MNQPTINIALKLYRNLEVVAKEPPSAGFPSPSGGVAPYGDPIWETAAFGGGEREYTNLGTMGAPYLGRQGRPGRGVSLAYAAFGGVKKIRVPSAPQISGAPFRGHLRRPKWF